MRSKVKYLVSMMSILASFIFLSAIFFFSNTVTAYFCENNELYIIRHPRSGLVLDGTDQSQIRVQHFTGYREQLWKFENSNIPGLFYIINNATGKVLDYYQYNRAVVLQRKSGALSNLWYLNWNNRITNAEKRYNIDIQAANYVAGTRVNVWKDNGDKAQEFILQKKT